MARQRRPGLRKRGATWHIEKTINGTKIYESTGETTYRRAEAYYDRRIKDIRQILILGDRPEVTFREAVAKFLKEQITAHLETLRPLFAPTRRRCRAGGEVSPQPPAA